MYGIHSVVQASFVKQSLDCAFGKWCYSKVHLWFVAIYYSAGRKERIDKKNYQGKTCSGGWVAVEKPRHRPLSPATANHNSEYTALQTSIVVFSWAEISLFQQLWWGLHKQKLFLWTHLAVSFSPAMKGQLFLMQILAVAFLHLGDWVSSMLAPFYSSECHPCHVNVHYLGISGSPGRQYKWERGLACVSVCVRVACLCHFP